MQRSIKYFQTFARKVEEKKDKENGSKKKDKPDEEIYILKRKEGIFNRLERNEKLMRQLVRYSKEKADQTNRNKQQLKAKLKKIRNIRYKKLYGLELTTKKLAHITDLSISAVECI